jgi:hypothetical protein
MSLEDYQLLRGIAEEMRDPESGIPRGEHKRG